MGCKRNRNKKFNRAGGMHTYQRNNSKDNIVINVENQITNNENATWFVYVQESIFSIFNISL
jgi:hypothetical protein